jgi:hypothetical protein
VGAVAAATLTGALVAPGVAGAHVPWPGKHAPKCVANVNNSGLSAAIVAHSHQTISNRTIRTKCDIGVFVGAGVTHVTIRHVSITGANFQAILAENTSYLTVSGSLIHGNGFGTIDTSVPPLPGSGVQSKVGQAFGISLFGVSHSMIAHNVVTYNGRGGIGVMDNGPMNPGTINQDPSAPVVGALDVVVENNYTSANYNGCGVVTATQNLGGSVSQILIRNNVIRGTGVSKKNGPDVGGIVAAANLPGSWASDVVISGNTVTNSFEGGVIVNSEAPGTYTDHIVVTGNRLSGNNFGLVSPSTHTAGVVVFAAPGTGGINKSTLVAGNTISRQYYGIISTGTNPATAFANTISVTKGGVPIEVE